MNNKVIVRSAGRKGRGVFAARRLGRGTLVIRNCVLPIKVGDPALGGKSMLASYVFWLGGRYMLCLGEGCLLNHGGSGRENLWYTYNRRLKTIDFFAARVIKAGAELTIDYGWESYPWEV
jgi:hypothetical protein